MKIIVVENEIGHMMPLINLLLIIQLSVVIAVPIFFNNSLSRACQNSLLQCHGKVGTNYYITLTGCRNNYAVNKGIIKCLKKNHL